jgi:hypothetical protein
MDGAQVTRFRLPQGDSRGSGLTAPSRRVFLAALAGAFVVDPERLLWVPGKKVISIPKPSACPTIEAQLDYMRRNPLYGLRYHDVSFASGQWLGLARTSQPITAQPVRVPIHD